MDSIIELKPPCMLNQATEHRISLIKREFVLVLENELCGFSEPVLIY